MSPFIPFSEILEETETIVVPVSFLVNTIKDVVFSIFSFRYISHLLSGWSLPIDHRFDSLDHSLTV